MSWHETPVEIRYADTDQMGVVHHAVYPIYCELGRTQLLVDLGLPYQIMEKAGIYLMVADLTCRFKAPARYGDAIVVASRISDLKRRLIEFEYQILTRTQRQVLFTGSTKHLFTEGTRGTIRCPDHFWKILFPIFSDEGQVAKKSSNTTNSAS